MIGPQDLKPLCESVMMAKMRFNTLRVFLIRSCSLNVLSYCCDSLAGHLWINKRSRVLILNQWEAAIESDDCKLGFDWMIRVSYVR